MASFKKLSEKKRKKLIDRINQIMSAEFHIDQESINGFWETFMTGAEKTEKA